MLGFGDSGAGAPAPRLLAVAAVFGNRSPMTALTRCVRITRRQVLASTRLVALRLWRVFRNNQGSTHGGTITYTTGG